MPKLVSTVRPVERKAYWGTLLYFGDPHDAETPYVVFREVEGAPGYKIEQGNLQYVAYSAQIQQMDYWEAVQFQKWIEGYGRDRGVPEGATLERTDERERTSFKWIWWEITW